MNAHTTTRPGSSSRPLPFVHTRVDRKVTREDSSFLEHKLEGLKGRATALSLAESRAQAAAATIKGAAEWFSFVARAAKEGVSESSEVDLASEKLTTARDAHKAAQAELMATRKAAVGATLRDIRVAGVQLAAAQRELWTAEESAKAIAARADQDLLRQVLKKRGC